MARLTHREAREILLAVTDGRGLTDFHALHSSQVEKLIGYADRRRYRTPVDANGSRARCFWQYVSRTLRSK